MPTATTQRYKVVDGSLKLVKGHSFEDKLSYTVQVEDVSVTDEIAERGFAKLQTVNIDIDRNAGEYSWNKRMLVAIYKPSYSVQRQTRNWISRLSDLPGLREEIVKRSKELWDTFKPSQDEMTKMTRGDYDKRLTTTVQSNRAGRSLTIEVKDLPYGGFKFDGELQARIDGDFPGVEGENFTIDFTKVTMKQAGVPGDAWNAPSISKEHTASIAQYVKPAVLRAVSKLESEIIAQMIEQMKKDVDWAERGVAQHRSQYVEARKNRTTAKKVLADFQERLAGR